MTATTTTTTNVATTRKKQIQLEDFLLNTCEWSYRKSKARLFAAELFGDDQTRLKEAFDLVDRYFESETREAGWGPKPKKKPEGKTLWHYSAGRTRGMLQVCVDAENVEEAERMLGMCSTAIVVDTKKTRWVEKGRDTTCYAVPATAETPYDRIGIVAWNRSYSPFVEGIEAVGSKRLKVGMSQAKCESGEMALVDGPTRIVAGGYMGRHPDKEWSIVPVLSGGGQWWPFVAGKIESKEEIQEVEDKAEVFVGRLFEGSITDLARKAARPEEREQMPQGADPVGAYHAVVKAFGGVPRMTLQEAAAAYEKTYMFWYNHEDMVDSVTHVEGVAPQKFAPKITKAQIRAEQEAKEAAERAAKEAAEAAKQAAKTAAEARRARFEENPSERVKQIRAASSEILKCVEWAKSCNALPHISEGAFGNVAALLKKGKSLGSMPTPQKVIAQDSILAFVDANA